MKKSLIIFLSLIFMSLSAYAAGVDCWDEMAISFKEEPTSKMQAVLGDDVEIIRVKTYMKGLEYSGSSTTPPLTNIEIGIYEPYAVTFNSNTHYLGNDTSVYTYTGASNPNASTKYFWYKGPVAFHKSSDYNYAFVINPYFASYTNSEGKNYYSQYRIYTSHDSYISGVSFYASHIIHTFCIANTNSGGGGGGAAGAAVNYIIKAD